MELPNDFTQYVEILNDCHYWKGPKSGNGYGQFTYNGIKYYAHRFVWEITNGPIQNNSLYVCHKCDNRKCVNIAHLFLASQSDNINDAVAKGRHFNSSKTHCANGHP